MGAEFFASRPLRVESVENRRKLTWRYTGPVVGHGDRDGVAVPTGAKPYNALWRAETHGIADQVAGYLRQAAFKRGHR